MNRNLTVNSAVLLASAFLLMHLFNEYSTAFAASLYGLKPILYIHSVKFYEYDLWTPYNVKRIFMVSGFMNLLFAILFFRFFLFVKKQNKWFRIFFLWCSAVGVMMFIGKVLAIPMYEFKPDPPGYTAFGVVAAYHYMGEPFKWIIAVFGFLLLILAGLFYSYQFLRLAESKSQLKKGTSRKDLIFAVVLIPYFAGIFIVAASNFPNNIQTIALYFFAGLVLIVSSILFSNRTVKVLVYREEPQKFSWFAIGLLVFLITFYRTFYERGIGCKGYFDFILCCDCMN